MNNITFFARTTFRNEMHKFGIKQDDRRRHMYLLGKTGMGKSTVQENMIIGDIIAGHGVAVVDPHGDLVEKIIEYIPDYRIDDVIYFNPSDIDYPIAFNVIERVEPHLRHLVASGLIGVFQKLWAESWGPRLEYILRNAILAILDYPNSTLLSVTRMLSDKDFRKEVVSKIEDPVVRSFWTKEFAGYADKFASEAIAPIQNKVGQFLSTSIIRNIVGQTKSSIDIREIMDNRKILIMNLSKGRIGEDNSALLGAIMITKIQLAAMSRVDIPQETRKDFYLYVDEFQNFATESFANILSEARKYHLNLIMANQYIEQLEEKVRDAVFGNVGTFVIFRVGAMDAEFLAPEFAPTFTEEDIVNIPKYEFYIKLMIDGIASDPFSAKGLPPLTPEEKTNNLEKIIQASRLKYSRAKNIVEEKIVQWYERIGENKKNALPYKSQTPPIQRGVYSNNIVKKKVEKRKEYPAICDRCNRNTKIPFEPDGSRPVFCEECLIKTRKDRLSNRDIGSERMPQKSTVYPQKVRSFDRPEHKNSIVQKNINSNKQFNEVSLSNAMQAKPEPFRKSRLTSNDDGERELKEGEEILMNTKHEK